MGSKGVEDVPGKRRLTSRSDMTRLELVKSSMGRFRWLFSSTKGRTALFDAALPGALIDAESRCDVTYRLHDGYDHSYYFVSTFMREHIEFHAKALKVVNYRISSVLIRLEGQYATQTFTLVQQVEGFVDFVTMRWVMYLSNLVPPAMYFSTSFGTAMRLLYPPKAVPFHVRP